MQLQIEIINVKQETKPTAKGSYEQLDVAYKRLDNGKIEGKKIMSFTNKEVFAILAKASNGSQLTVTSERNEKSGYWDWIGVQATTGGTTTSNPTPSKGVTASPKSTYETPEERAARQVMIVRQSSLAQAVATLTVNAGKDKLQVEDILKLADQYVSWVMQKDEPMPDFADMGDDIPY